MLGTFLMTPNNKTWSSAHMKDVQGDGCPTFWQCPGSAADLSKRPFLSLLREVLHQCPDQVSMSSAASRSEAESCVPGGTLGWTHAWLRPHSLLCPSGFWGFLPDTHLLSSGWETHHIPSNESGWLPHELNKIRAQNKISWNFKKLKECIVSCTPVFVVRNLDLLQASVSQSPG